MEEFRPRVLSAPLRQADSFYNNVWCRGVGCYITSVDKQFKWLEIAVCCSRSLQGRHHRRSIEQKCGCRLRPCGIQAGNNKNMAVIGEIRQIGDDAVCLFFLPLGAIDGGFASARIQINESRGFICLRLKAKAEVQLRVK